MPELKCTVQTCVHNQDFLCRLDSIQVGGSQAKASKETCCDSFEERKTSGMENSYANVYGNHAGTPSDKCGINCKATDCMYNEQCKCEAGKVSVEGSCACHKDGTECATFQCK